MRKIILTTLLFSMCLDAAHATTIPRSLSADARIKVVQYDPNNIVELTSRFGYQTQITFGANETVQNVSLGDSLAWQAVPISNYLFIKPLTASKTNMTVLTNINSYNFQLLSQDENLKPTYKLQFIYSPGGYSQTGQANAVHTFEPDKINWKYSYTGDLSLAPIEAFDNGQFTYFKFKSNGMSRLPSVFIVDKKRKETLVNYHMQGNYLVVHSVANQFTLRNGDYVTSVYNDLAIGDWMNL